MKQRFLILVIPIVLFGIGFVAKNEVLAVSFQCKQCGCDCVRSDMECTQVQCADSADFTCMPDSASNSCVKTTIPTTCSGDADCPDTLYCKNSVCTIPPCLMSLTNQCQVDVFKDHGCVREAASNGISCTMSNGSDGKCLSGSCAKSCNVNDDCSDTEKCNSSGVCEELVCATIMPPVCQKNVPVPHTCSRIENLPDGTSCVVESTSLVGVCNSGTCVEKLSNYPECQKGVPPKSEGNSIGNDGMCDSTVNISDFAVWKAEFIAYEKSKENKNNWRSDFDNSGTVTISDFAIWKQGFIKYANPSPTVEPVCGWCGTCTWKTPGVLCPSIATPADITCNVIEGECKTIKISTGASCEWCGGCVWKESSTTICPSMMIPVGKACEVIGGECTMVNASQ